MGYKNTTSIITLTARQIAELAQMAGFTVDVDRFDDDELDESEFTIITCPEAGILDEDSGHVYHTKYAAYPEATFGDGECEPLTDPKD